MAFPFHRERRSKISAPGHIAIGTWTRIECNRMLQPCALQEIEQAFHAAEGKGFYYLFAPQSAFARVKFQRARICLTGTRSAAASGTYLGWALTLIQNYQLSSVQAPAVGCSDWLDRLRSMDSRTLRQDFPRVADSLHYERPSGEISLRASLDSHPISPLVHNYRLCLYPASFGKTEFDYFARNRTGYALTLVDWVNGQNGLWCSCTDDCGYLADILLRYVGSDVRTSNGR
jgi:hypothetical protein